MSTMSMTFLGSKTDYTPEAARGPSMTRWCVKKLQEAGGINLVQLSMEEFGIGSVHLCLDCFIHNISLRKSYSSFFT